MESLSAKAAVSTIFTYLQFAISLSTGIILFPLVIHSVGAHHFGLWLATGEAISLVLLGDLGVFAVLPWLIAASIGSNDLNSLRQNLSNSVAIGSVIGLMLLSVCIVLQALSPMDFGVPLDTWDTILFPTSLLFFLNGLAYPLRAFNALLVGAQDVFFVGCLSVSQSLLTLTLTLLMIVTGSGLLGLALATGLPPLVTSVLALLRTFRKHRYAIADAKRPDFSGCMLLLKEGFGAWLGALGVRLMNASNGIILTSFGRPDWATILASTGKIGQTIMPLCSTVPDSGLVGISQVKSSKDSERARHSAVCLILLYAVIPSFGAIGLLVLNPAFVSWWLGPHLYAGHYVNTLSALTVIVASVAGGLVKMVAVVGWRQSIGWITLISGLAYGLVGCALVNWRGLSGLAEAALLVWTFVFLPIGIYLVSVIYGLSLEHFLAIGATRWLAATLLALVVSATVGIGLADHPVYALIATPLCVLSYGFLMRPTLTLAPWPHNVRRWLYWLRVIRIVDR